MSDKEKPIEDSKKTIHRVEKLKNYSIICNTGLHDDRLSWEARGMLAYMLTMPDDWDFYNEELAKHSPQGVSVVKRIMRELKKFGYVKRVPIKDPVNHRIKEWETVLYEVPREPDKEGEKDPPGDENPEVENRTPGTKPENTPEVENPHSGNPGSLESHRVENRPLLITNDLPITNEQSNPIREQQAAPDESPNVPDIQKATAILFLQMGKKPELSPDDREHLNLLFQIHTPAAIQKGILESFERLQKNGHVKIEHEGKTYNITKKEKLPIRYVYNSMKNWTSLKGTGNKGGGNHGKSRGNPARNTKNYEGDTPDGFFYQGSGS